jgi:hypothetical protein
VDQNIDISAGCVVQMRWKKKSNLKILVETLSTLDSGLHRGDSAGAVDDALVIQENSSGEPYHSCASSELKI